MKKLFTLSLFSCCLFVASAGKGFTTWEKYSGAAVPTKGVQRITPHQFQVFSLQEAYFKDQLFSLSLAPEQAQVISLPTPDGGTRNFKVWRYSMMEEELAAKYPGIRTFSGYAEGNQRVTVRLDYTYKGFHAMVMDGANTYFIDPYSNLDDGYYICYYKKYLTRNINQVMTCEVQDDILKPAEEIHLTPNGLPQLQMKTHGSVLKEYRLALSCTGEYAIAVAGPSPTKPDVLSAMTTTVNRINGVYERELAVRLNLIANNDTLIHLVSGYDAVNNPFSNSSSGSMLGQNQNVVTQRIGSANYDIGHVFSTGGGGVASLGCVCDPGDKARGVTGSANPVGDAFDIDYVAHEMGHQFGASHTFNAATGSCAGNGSSNSAYEPGSGSTIMAYAGICSGNDLQQHSDDYFHARSLDAISNYINYAPNPPQYGGGSCPVETPTNNTPPVIPSFTVSYDIPERTPFELTAPEAVDTDNDSLSYCWEQWNRGNFQLSFTQVRTRGPIFRSFEPTTSPTRVFPAMPKVLQGILNYMGEKVPDTTRFLTFKLTVRDMLNGIGSFNFSDDTVHLDVTELAGPFTVTSQASAVTIPGGTYQNVTWDVANTDQPPVLCDSVVVYLSFDGGTTFQVAHSGTPNDGSELVFFPNIPTVTTARLKVKAKSNVFFNVNTSNFTIQYDPTNVEGIDWANDVVVYPVPASEVLQITNRHHSALQATIYNTVGQQVWQGQVAQQTEVAVSAWADGVYYLQLIDAKGERLTKPVVIR